MDITIETITPEMASSMLAKNRNNRPLNKTHVDFLAAQITNGYFMVTGDSIKISKEDELIDGQHRLAAVVRAGVSVKCAVATGVDRSVFEVLDTGRTRKASDALAIAGYKNYVVLSSAARNIIQSKAGMNSRSGRGRSGKGFNADIISHKSILDFVEKNENMLTEAVSFSLSAYSKCRLLMQSEYATYYYLFSEKSQADAIEFLSRFASGANLEDGSPILLLRRVFEKNLSGSARLTQYAKKYFMVRAWNAYRSKRTLGVLQYNSAMKMPEIE